MDHRGREIDSHGSQASEAYSKTGWTQVSNRRSRREKAEYEVVIARADRGQLVRFQVRRRNSPRGVVDRGWLVLRARYTCLEIRWGRDLGCHVRRERMSPSPFPLFSGRRHSGMI